MGPSDLLCELLDELGFKCSTYLDNPMTYCRFLYSIEVLLPNEKWIFDEAASGQPGFFVGKSKTMLNDYSFHSMNNPNFIDTIKRILNVGNVA